MCADQQERKRYWAASTKLLGVTVLPHPGPHSPCLQPLACWPPRPGLAPRDGKDHHVDTGADLAFQPCGPAWYAPRPGVGTWGLARCRVMAATMDSVPPARMMASFTSSLPAMALRALSTCFTSSWTDSNAQVTPSSTRASCAGLLGGGRGFLREGVGLFQCLLSEHTWHHSGAGRWHGTARLSITRCIEKAGEAWGGGPCGSGHLHPGQAFG